MVVPGGSGDALPTVLVVLPDLTLVLRLGCGLCPFLFCRFLCRLSRGVVVSIGVVLVAVAAHMHGRIFAVCNKKRRRFPAVD